MFGQYAGDGGVWSDIIAIVINNMKITEPDENKQTAQRSRQENPAFETRDAGCRDVGTLKRNICG
jgi:hypothetical protein